MRITHRPTTTWIKCKSVGESNATLIGPSWQQSPGRHRRDYYFQPHCVGTGDNFTLAERLKDLFDRKTVSQIVFDAANGPAIVEAGAPESFFQTELAITFNAFVQ